MMFHMFHDIKNLNPRNNGKSKEQFVGFPQPFSLTFSIFSHLEAIVVWPSRSDFITVPFNNSV